MRSGGSAGELEGRGQRREGFRRQKPDLGPWVWFGLENWGEATGWWVEPWLGKLS